MNFDYFLQQMKRTVSTDSVKTEYACGTGAVIETYEVIK
jgi:hypothetical protein